MTTPFIGEIRMFGFAFPPRGWAFCNGQTLAIQQNAALFSILGTTYGGNGTSTFQLPNLQSRIPFILVDAHLAAAGGGPGDEYFAREAVWDEIDAVYARYLAGKIQLFLQIKFTHTFSPSYMLRVETLLCKTTR